MRRRHQRVMQRVIIGVLVPTIALCVTVLGLSIFMPRLAVEPEPANNQQSVAVNKSSLEAVSDPVKLSIDRINVAATIKPVGLTPSGDMAIDDNPTELAWYQYGPRPGETGSAVVAGHYGWKNTIPSVFNDLSKLEKGDEITVRTQNEEIKRFVVTKTALYNPDQDATDVFRSNDGKAHLNLITCQGAWDNAEQTYTKRLVVFTDYVEES
jgi:sortase A